MSKKTHIKPVATAIGVALAGALGTNVASAAENPFGLSEIGSGYMQVAQAEGKCGEGKCGGDKAKAETEGKCGGDKAESEGKCGGDKDKATTEGKCGEGKCGGQK